MAVRQPINLVLLKGNKHLTKAEIADRQEREIKAPADKITVPSYLPKELRSDFKKIATELKRIELMSNLDLDSLARFLLSREQYVRTSVLLREHDPVEDHYMYGKLLANVNILFNQSKAAAADLGLTITSRCKLLVPKAKKTEPSEFDKKFGDV